MGLPQPELADLGEFIAALALGAMGKLDVPGEQAPVDPERARWFVDLLGVLLESLSSDVPSEQRKRIEQLHTQLRMAALQG